MRKVIKIFKLVKIIELSQETRCFFIAGGRELIQQTNKQKKNFTRWVQYYSMLNNYCS